MANIGASPYWWQKTIILFALAGILGLTGLYTVLGVGMNMTAHEMTSMARDMAMFEPEWTLAYGIMIFWMWWIMMIAMMIPSVSPMALLYVTLQRRQGSASVVSSGAMFIGGYLLIWGLFSFGATVLQWALNSMKVVSPMMLINNGALCGLVLLMAGLYQLTPLKRSCLAHCQNPVRFLVSHPYVGLFGAMRLGISHGIYCVGCCVMLMALLFVGGIMNLYWIAGLAVYVLLERWLVSMKWIARCTGIALAGTGVLALASAALE